MKCPYCGSLDNKVVDSRETENDMTTRRRRECLKCQKRWTTYERSETTQIMVIKKDGNRAVFDRNKIIGGILKACEKRPIEKENIDKLAEDIEAELRSKDFSEVPSKKIGQMITTRLKRLDKVAYIRFASVYKEFKDIEDFEAEVSRLKK